MKKQAQHPQHLMTQCNFDAVDDDELEACFYYEYARELKGLHVAVKHYRQRKVDKPLPKLSVFKHQLAFALARSAGFPKAWQTLSKATKASLTETLPDAINALEPAKALNIVEGWNPGFGSVQDWSLQVVNPVNAPYDVIKMGAFAMNLAAGAPAIAKEFDRWVRKLVRSLGKFERANAESAYPLRKPGPTGWRTALNQLGALRWRYYCKQSGMNFPEASQDAAWKKSKPSLYANQSTFNRACKAALQQFKALFPNQSDVPIHSTKGWRN
jgi:hypothetical protein